MLISTECLYRKDKSFNMIVVKFLKRHFLKLLIAFILIYLVVVLKFFGSVSQDNSNYQGDRAYDKKTRQEHKELIDRKTEEAHIITSKFQNIDSDTLHRQNRLKVLHDIYLVPHSDDSVYKLNESLSRTIDLDRPAPDMRPRECKRLKYDDQLPTVTIIMPIYNEALSMLLRAVHSAINNTPQRLLKEIILVDDDSKNENLKEPLDRYLKYLPSKVWVLRNEKREGLIRARMRGAANATGDVLMFQDVHTEFSPGWAEPVLQFLKNHPNTVIQPTVEELNVNTISWPHRRDDDVGEDLWRGVFMWDMRYAWNLAPKKYTSWQLTPVDPFPNPVLVGCSLAVDRKWFFSIGGFDQGLNVWGGENIELSLRAWMCGGRVVIHPCSRIAHVFKPFSYSFDGDKEKIVAKNSIRVVETWMDDYRHYFYASNFVYDYKRAELDETDKESLRKHKQLRQELKCKSFEWYLDNVLPEMARPGRDVRHFGEVQNYISKACFLVNDDDWISMTGDCYTYSRLKHDMEFSLSNSGQLLFFGRCVAVQDNLLLKVQLCGTDTTRENGWLFEVIPEKGMQIGKVKFRFADGAIKCLQQITNILDIYTNQQMPQLMNCVDSVDVIDWQSWYITYNLDYSLVPNSPV